ncbi:hypothetical protein ABZ802_31520 [Streptomyces sp. NPDC047737]|uniref:hypothetical protein n=1 Tax=Streptomyces sp. NPDC047737 TaxID=3155740 RepID=UPI0033C675E0
MDQDRKQDTRRCSAVHADDPTPCAGPRDAVTVLDGNGGAAVGCEHHGARMLASLDGARVEPGSVVGAATRVLEAADTIRPFCWYETAPRTQPAQLSRAENRAAAATR